MLLSGLGYLLALIVVGLIVCYLWVLVVFSVCGVLVGYYFAVVLL